ncbi:MAG: substrate-binding domain-containing protein [Alistipes sp.]|nr:substrate-binding domain-containing protein [Alistipes sp.]
MYIKIAKTIKYIIIIEKSGLIYGYFARILQGIKTYAEAMGYGIAFITNRIAGKRMTYSGYCRYRQFDGVVIADVDFSQPQVATLVNSGIPVVTIDHVFDNTISIMSDNVKGIRDLMEYLYEMGHRKIAYIHGAGTSVTRDRITSFYQCVERLKLDIPEEYVLECRYRDTGRAARCTERLLSLEEPPTCIMYPDDFTAISGVGVIRRHNLNIPEDISVVGYDGTSYSRIHEPTITTLEQDTERIGKLAAARLIELIERPRTTLKETYVIEGSVLVGNSVKRLNE